MSEERKREKESGVEKREWVRNERAGWKGERKRECVKKERKTEYVRK